jgi:DNA polymerase (family 10)
VLREDLGEVEAAEAGGLPAAPGALSGDFHVHTSLSGDGRSSLEEMVDAALGRGYSVLALTDHAEGTVSGVGRSELLQQRDRIRALQAELGDRLLLLHGVELNIGPAGELDFDAEFRQSFDWCVASVHSHFELDRARQTQRILSAMADPSVRMIGHLSARMIGGRPPIDLDLPAVLEKARATDTALEINGALPRLDPAVDTLRLAKQHGVKLVLTSDAHHTRELALIEFAALHAQRAWLEASQIVNTWSGERLRSWVAA